MPANPAMLLVYADVQMAAEAIFPTGFVAGSIAPAWLTTGNNRSSRFALAHATKFAAEWQIVNHKPNTETGFSGTLFRYIGENTDPTRGPVFDDLVLSFRSTEFIDDAARDNQATNSMEIKEFGWAFGQIADMKHWIDSLRAQQLIPTGKPLTVTGYSLGGHLAGAYNHLMDDAGTTGRIAATYTFNGAGVGYTLNNVSLTQTINQFEQDRQVAADHSLQFTAGLLRSTYQELRGILHGGAPLTTERWDEVSSFLSPLSLVSSDAKLLFDALTPGKDDSGGDGAYPHLSVRFGRVPPNPLRPVRADLVRSTDLNYQVAVLLAARNTGAVGLLTNAWQAMTTREPGPLQFDNFYDVYGSTNPSAVANSQYHYGQAVPVFIEDQPLVRGHVAWNFINQFAQYTDVKLLYDNFGVNDFGDTHSLVLIVDSLSVQQALQQLAPEALPTHLDALLRAASNAKADFDWGDQGQAEHDTLERVLQALGDITGASKTSSWRVMRSNPEGNTWATVQDKSGYTGRDTFHKNLEELQRIPAFTNLLGQVRIEPTHTWQAAQTDFAALQSLTAGATFALRLDDASPSSAGSQALRSGNLTTFQQWQTDQATRAADLLAEYRGSLNFSSVYLSSRALFLNSLAQANTFNDGFVYNASLTKAFEFSDRSLNLSSSLVLAPGPSGSWPTQRVIFGNSNAETIEGEADTTLIPNSAEGVNHNDYLFGGDGDDTLRGLAGSDYLEGGNGNDELHGGTGRDYVVGNDGDDKLISVADGIILGDQLLGGRGNDEYHFYAGASGTIWDTDGLGSVWYGGNRLNGAVARLTQYDSVQVFQTDQFTYTYQGVDANHPTSGLMIHRGGSKSEQQEFIVTIGNWANGDLGINLQNLGPVLGPGGNGGGSGGRPSGGGSNLVLLPPLPSGELRYIPPQQPSDYTPKVPKRVKDLWEDAIIMAPRRDPLVIDLDRDGLELRAADGQVLFDHNADGIRTGTGWSLPDDALLVWDRNGNGIIDTGRELFGVDTLKSNGQFASDGFDALRDLDANADGMFNSADARYANLRSWRDLDQDGVADAGELQGLAASGIASISLSSTPNGALINNNRVDATSLVTRSDGLTTIAGAVDFAENLFAREFTGQTVQGALAITSAAQALPFMRGSGMVRDLSEAMSLIDLGTGQLDARSTALTSAMQSYASAATRDAQQAQLDALLRTWSATSDHQTSLQSSTALAPGGAETAVAKWARLNPTLYQKIEVLERFNGINFLERRVVAVSGGFDVQVWAEQVTLIDSAYATLRDNAYVGLLTQTRLAPYANGVRLLMDEAGSSTLDASGVVIAFEAVRTVDPAKALIDLAEFNRYAQWQAQTLRFDAASLFSAWMDALAADSPLRSAVAALDVQVGTVSAGGVRSDTQVGSSAANTFSGGDGDDVLVGAAGADTLRGDAGDDVAFGGDGNDVIEGGVGNDSLLGGAGNDNLSAYSGTNVMDGGDGDDVITGTADYYNWSSNTLLGGAGNDTLSVNTNYTGGNVFDGGSGTDTITGGGNADTYRFNLGNGIDNVSDQGGTDKIVVGGEMVPADITVLRSGTSLVFRHANGVDQLNVNNWFASTNGSNFVETVEFADGTLWASVALTSAALVVNGTSGADTLSGTVFGDTLYGLGGNDNLSAYSGTNVMDGGDGDDVIAGTADYYNWSSNTLLGGAGNDTLSVNTQYTTNNIFDGGPGTDAMTGGGNADTYRFNLGNGIDNVTDQGGNDRIVMGAGIAPADITALRSGTSLVFRHANSTDQLNINNWFASTNGSNFVETVEFADGTLWASAALTTAALVVQGTAGNDTLSGTVFGDTLYGLGGDDTLSAYSGTNIMDGGDGDDVITGTADYYNWSSNTLLGGAGNDTLSVNTQYTNSNVFDGGPGTDIITGGGYSDTYRFNLGNGIDNVSDQGGTDKIVMGVGIAPADITVYRSGTTLAFRHSNGADQLNVNNWFASTNGGYYVETVEFTDGTLWNSASLTAQALVVQGTAGNDTLSGTVFGDTLYGLGGNDNLSAYSGTNIMDGGDGDDVVTGTADYYNWSSNTLLGGAGNDTLSVNTQYTTNNVFDGGPGTDTINGGGHADIYRFKLGNGIDNVSDQGGSDKIVMGAGISAADISVSRSGNTLVFRHANGVDQLNVNNWFAVTSGGYYVETVEFADGTAWNSAALTTAALVVQGTAGNDTLSGTVFGDTLYGLGGNDTLSAYSGTNVMDGGDGDDVITGTADYYNWSSNTLLGGAGNDTLSVNTAYTSGNTFDGGAGTDAITGSLNADTYRFNLGNGIDNVADPSGTDRIVMGAGIIPADLTVLRSGTSLVFRHTNGVDQLNVINWFATTNGNNFVETVEFTDGTLWTSVALTSSALVVQGTAGNDTLSGTVFGDTLYGLGGNDNLSAYSGTNVMDGGDGDDVITGTADYYNWSSNTLLGGAGNDTLSVNTAYTSGNTFDGGAGTDSISGSLNADTYRFNLGNGIDNVADPSGTDRIVMGAAIVPADITVLRSGTSLAFRHTNGVDQLNVNNWFASTNGNNFVETVEFTNGTLWTAASLTAQALLVNGTAGADTLSGTVFGDTLYGLGGNDNLSAYSGTNLMDGGDGDDVITGTADYYNWSSNTLVGGAGNDTLSVNTNYTSGNTFDGGPGTDAITGSLNADTYRFNLGNGIDNVSDQGGTDKIVMGVGIAPADIVVYRSGTTLVFRHANGADQLNVNNWFVSSSHQVEALEFADGTAQSASAVTAAALLLINGTGGADALTGTGTNELLLGLDGNDTLDGAAGNDTLSGGAGNDTMRGGLGDDTYDVDNAADIVTENANEGLDTVRAGMTWTLGANLEDLVLIGSAAINGTGNALANRVWGNAAPNRLDGSTGADTMTGRAGDDTYIVDNTADLVVEAAGEGSDTVQSSVNFTLAANVEHLTLTGTALTGTGNDLANVLLGNAAANTLTGGAGNDTLNGGTGADTMSGGLGDDSYVVDSTGDVVTEAAGEGTDTISSSVTRTLGSHQENLTLTGTANLSGTGNTLDNILIGNAGNNTLLGDAGNDLLDGGAGTDTMTGGAGNDVFRIDNSKDKVTENAGEGTDRVESTLAWTLASNLEDLTLLGTSAVNGTGNAVANVLVGNAAANTLSGLAGNDTLDGGVGNDTLIGGAGADSYRFGVGRGVDTVQENDAAAGVVDRVDFGSLLQSQIAFARSGNNLEASIVGNGADKLIVKDWYLGAQYQVEQFAFGDGSALTNAQVQGLVSAMAAFSASDAAEGTMLSSTPRVMIDRGAFVAVQVT